MILPKLVYVARLSPNASNNDKEAYVTISNAKIDIQPASAELTAVAEGVYGQTFRAYTPASGISIGDMLTVSGTNDSFIVKGVDNWNYGAIPHLELVLFKADD